ncbi:hypothetical protein Aspvir_004406 [Aspergillus viridinutans]|uniref:Uncharacterized protein n=1 Tax=Aspergillus viridinutans TaxID=75553 RepID=A0A9P3BPZ8_ASPVI|nr:uncharacterized protein Aspvir_004406 [Aspergillus viridinutans]GIK00383.1 hypothetical protein Aspvir_004406 [Aspergillus viridinutans]
MTTRAPLAARSRMDYGVALGHARCNEIMAERRASASGDEILTINNPRVRWRVVVSSKSPTASPPQQTSSASATSQGGAEFPPSVKEEIAAIDKFTAIQGLDDEDSN